MLEITPLNSIKVIGVDLSQEMLKIAKAKIPNALFIRADAYNSPFKKEVFDLVLSVTMFEHEPEKVLNEVHRALKSGPHRNH